MQDYSLQEFTSYDELLDATCAAAADLVSEQGRCTVLVPNFERMVALKALLAARGCGFGVAVESPASWIADLWERYGDGRQFSTSLDRQFAVWLALAEQAALPKTTGMVRFIANVMKDAASAALDSQPRHELSEGESASLAVARDALAWNARACNLVEQSEACVILATQGAIAAEALVVSDCTLGFMHDELLKTAASVRVLALKKSATFSPERAAERTPELNQLSARLYEPDYENPIEPTGSARFVLPSGRYAAADALVEEVASSLQRAGVAREAAGCAGAATCAIAAKNPQATFDETAQRFLARGIGVRLQGSIPIGRTAFGIAWLSILGFAQDGTIASVSLATDYTRSLFSFMNGSSSNKLDARMRAWRGETADDAFTDVAGNTAEAHRDVPLALAEGRYLDALGLIRDWASRQYRWPETFRDLQLFAIDAAREIHSRAEKVGFTLEPVKQILAAHDIAYRAEVLPEDGDDAATEIVTILSQKKLAERPPASFDVVAIADLTVENYALKEDDRALDLLLQKLGIYKDPRRIERMYATFSCAIAAASKELLLMRRLNDEDANEDLPAVLFEEAIDCYRRTPQQDRKELDKVLKIPHVFTPFAASRGEEKISKILSLGAQEPVETGFYEVHSKKTPENIELLIPNHFSASAIEAYLGCPYKWFAERRLGIGGLDAQLDPLSKGSFAHRVFQQFHELLPEFGCARVTPENVERLLPQFNSLFDAAIEEDACSYKDNAVFPLNKLEELDIATLRRNMEGFIRWEASLAPEFSPYRAELSFGFGQDQPFEYAGVRLRGSIDRVDTDSFGRVIVLDYKSSSSDKQYFFGVARDDGEDGFALPQQVQAAIYAQVVRRRFGLQPVAALYVSYGKNPGAKGLYDQLILDPKNDLLEINPKKCGTSDFLGCLDRTEDAIARALEQLFAGNIEPVPTDKNTCEYCSVIDCPGRGSKGKGAK